MARLPLTVAQEGVWLGQRLDPSSPLYNAAEYLEVGGPIDSARFERALRRAVAEAEAVHARFFEGTDRVEQVLHAPGDWKLPILEVSAREDAVSWMREDLAQLVDLERGPLFAHALFRLGCGRVLWYHRAHHIALDGYGFSLLAGRVAALYNNHAGPPFGSLRDVVDDDIAYQRSRQRRDDHHFWQRRFADRPAVATLCHGLSPPCGRVVRHSAELPASAMTAWRETAREAGCTWAQVVLALVACYVQRQTSAAEVILGVPIMGRLGSPAARTPSMIVNVMPLRVAILDDARLPEVLRAVVRELDRVTPHRRYRAEHLRRDLRLVGGGRRLYGPVVNILPFDYGLRFGPHRAVARNLAAGAQFVEDLAIHIHVRFDGEPLVVDIDANAALYGPAELAAHHEQLTDVLTGDAVLA